MSAVGVFTLMKRVTFVKGWLTGGTDPADGSVECGVGTAFPMAVTLDQIAEIFYRAKDAWFTSGSLIDIDSGGVGTESLTFTGTDPSGVLVTDDTDYKSQRGYYTVDTVPAAHDGYFGTAYTVSGTDVREVATNERCMWIPPSDVAFSGDALGSGFSGYSGPEIGCAFSTYMIIDTSTEPTGYALTFEPWPDVATYPVFTGITKELWLIFSGEIAWVGGEGPFDPAAALYLGVYFEVNGSGSDFSTLVGSGYLLDESLALELSSGTVTCPLYGNEGSGSGTDFTCTVKEWWPYAKDSPAVPVWDADTGLKL